jgi:hypothetical protein
VTKSDLVFTLLDIEAVVEFLTPAIDIFHSYATVSLESRCAIRLRYVDLIHDRIDARGHHF